MALQKQIVELPFHGLQTKVDPKLAPIGTYQVLDNVVMDRMPELKKRLAVSTIGASSSPSNITSAYSYFNETGVLTNQAAYSYSQSTDTFLNKGSISTPIITSNPIISNTYTQVNTDSAVTANGIMGIVWEDSRSGIRYSIKDLNSNTFIVSDLSLSATGVKPAVIAVNNLIYFIWVETGTTSLTIAQFNPVSSVLSSSTVVNNAMDSAYVFSAVPFNNNIIIAVNTTASSPGSVICYYWDSTTNSVGGTGNSLPSPASLALTNAGSAMPAVSLCVSPTNSYFTFSWINSSKQVYTKTFSAAIVAITSELQVSSAKTDAGRALATCNDSSNNTYFFYSTYSSAHTSFQALVSSNINSPSVTYNRLFIQQMSILSKAIYYSGNAYVILAYDSTLQATYFGMRDDGYCFARLFSTLAGGSATKANCLTNLNTQPLQTNTFICSLLKTSQIVSSANSFYSQTSVYSEQLYFTPSSIDTRVLGQYLNIAGGYLKQYDGSKTIFEQGFHLYPEGVSLVQSSGGSMTVAGVYSYIVCWEWRDNLGQLHRSNTSLPVNITMTGSNGTVAVTVKTLPITQKETRFNSARTPVVMAVYRTATLGSQYYRVNQLTANYVYNDSTATTITFTDTVADSTLISNSLLYTTGGIFDNIATPCGNLMAVAKNRVVIAGVDTLPNQIFISHQLQAGLGVEFANELSQVIDSYGGPITAIAAMDDKILIFKKSLLYYIAGEGPDPTGNNGSFTTPLLISADTGCSTPQSIVLTGLGIMFQSPKGIYLCDRNLNVSYYGQSVDAITQTQGSSITSAVNLPDRNRVYFTTNQNSVIVHDTFWNSWFTHTYQFNTIGSSVLTNTWYVVSSTNMLKENSSVFYDANGLAIQTTLQTNWITVNNLGGYARVQDVMIVGYGSANPHRLVVELYYDYEDNPTSTDSILPLSKLGGTYGSGATYGSDTPYGGGSLNTPYEYLIRPSRQKCSVIMLKIYDQFPDGSRNSSFNFTGLSFVISPKTGYNKTLSMKRRLT